MKKKLYFILTLLLIVLSACKVEDNKKDEDLPGETVKLLVLSEGSYTNNNSTLAFYDLKSKTKDADYFLTQNKRRLGETANDMLLYGSKAYIAMNGSSRIEIIDIITGKSLKQIPMFEGEKAMLPRQIISHKGKVYVSSFDDTVTRIDTVSLNIDGNVRVGLDPEGMCVVGDKLYVANSGGLEWANGYDKTISVVDISSFKELEKIEVNVNPVHLRADTQGDIYAVTNGNYDDMPAKFQRIDTKTKTVSDIDMNLTNLDIFVNKAYTYSYDYISKQMSVQVFDCLTEKLINNRFISDETSLKIPYSIQVDPYSKDVYITDAIDNTVLGDVFCFDKTGKLKFQVKEVGINPNHVILID